ncbi:unnamed protein product [Peronospora destructor]|uniref:RxLR effector protein n=2 Tax=Peronospora destructor TaxID=86335 RepID=A0AAV0TMK8_9STRA|nr:unnamed protein product [Peronospora destructor]
MKMLSESSIAQFSHTKMLIFFVVLVACSAKSVTAAASTPEEAVGSPPVLDARSAAYTSLSVQRYLRSMSDKINNSEERAGWADVRAALMSNLQKGWPEIQWLRVKRWDIAFTSSNLHKKEPMTLFEDPEFFKFVSIVESNYPGNIDQQAEVKSWIGKKTEHDVFNLLKLGEIEDGKLFAGQAFSQFISFVSKSAKSEQKSDDTLYKILYKSFGNRLWGLLEEAMIANPDPVAEQLVKMQLQKWRAEYQQMGYVFGRLQLEADSKLFTSVSGIYWLKYVYLLKGNDDESVLIYLELAFDKMVPLMLSAARKEGAPEQELMQKLQEIQFGNWMNAKWDDKDVRKILSKVLADKNLIEKVLIEKVLIEKVVNEYADFKVSRLYALLSA